jgi:hypothetical protein
MGSKKKLHREKVARRNAMLNNPITRGAVALVSRKGVIAELSKGDPSANVQEMVDSGRLNESKLASAIKSKAPHEMDKAIKTYQKQGKEITVATLTEEARNDKSFLKMCAGAGIDISYFENLAKERMQKLGIAEVK